MVRRRPVSTGVREAMTYTLCASCGHHRGVRESSTGRLFWFCENVKCPEHGSQEWLPEPIHEEISREVFIAIGILLVCALAWIGLDKFEGRFRGGQQNGSVSTQAIANR